MIKFFLRFYLRALIKEPVALPGNLNYPAMERGNQKIVASVLPANK